MPTPAVINGLSQTTEGLDEISSINLDPKKPGKPFKQTRYIAAGSLPLDGNGNCVPVIFDEKQQWKMLEARCVDGLPKFAFASSAFTGTHERNLIRS